MRLLPSDPDVETLILRILKGDINLQPDFQRGEVWGPNKKVRLIDSILREWHVPPLHVIKVKESGKQEVLDGQQRLVAIRDFVNGKIAIDGYIEPLDQEILELHGLTYKNLPDVWRRKFEQFTIRVYYIVDYHPSEPGELFYRLNQPTNLTSAEQRNAYFGPARQQIKEIVKKFDEFNLTKNEIGFSNSRMAYDDVVARLCMFLEFGTLREKITATTLADRYRDGKGFDNDIIIRVEKALENLSKATKTFDGTIKFNKATLLSWLTFIVELNKQAPDISSDVVGRYIYIFETCRTTAIKRNENIVISSFKKISPNLTIELFNIFNDRASSRVADVLSVVSRDAIIWIMFIFHIDMYEMDIIDTERVKKVNEFLFKSNLEDNHEIYESLMEIGWGNSI
ncbi:DUF262 domain-containing protein [Psychrobacillus sp. OK032]|uniref:DUF262 domain-containing protein n=1 Tax=Psychrobacillus sp. OK032 TaxID=1884358 RepID=UPI0008C425CF|nr:DUF262 domain-containing protein [Psychrobacillus sp. OK032]SES17683.1 Protein of unknown function DUF262 [Psychrobacillus sp. OK032]